jgi:hypothetical protein
VSIFGNVAEIAAERMEELAGRATLRDAGTTAGIATDKLLALSGEPALTIHHEHTHTHQHELIQALNNAVERIEKRAQAAVVEVPTLPPRDASVAGENLAAKLRNSAERTANAEWPKHLASATLRNAAKACAKLLS